MAAAVTSRVGVLFAERQTGVLGANDRIRVGLIGCGNRGNQVATDWMKHKDSVFTAACDVAQDRLEKTAARLGQTQNNTRRDLRGLPAHPRSQGCRCGPHRHARSLARSHDRGRLRRRQGRLRREARLQRDRARTEDDRGRAQVHARRAGRLAAAKLAPLPGSGQAVSRQLRRDRRQSLPDVPSRRRRIRGAAAATDAAGTSARLQLGTVSGPREAQAIRAGPEKLARLVRLRRRKPHGLGRAPDGRHALVHEDGQHGAAA